MTLKQITERLAAAGIEDAEFDAAQIMGACFDISKAQLYAGADVSSPKLENMIRRRESRYPLQYILGKWEFMGCDFQVSPNCLIPRADTEILCSHLIDVLPRSGSFADLCTGSGCIAISALKLRPDIKRAVAVELFSKTAEIARLNSVDNNTDDRLEIICDDVCNRPLGDEKFDVIVSNPPYITTEEMNTLSPELKYEPRAALTDEQDGLSIIKKIIDIYPDNLNDGGTLAIEIGCNQACSVTEYASHRGICYKVIKDFGGRDRVVSMTK